MAFDERAPGTRVPHVDRSVTWRRDAAAAGTFYRIRSRNFARRPRVCNVSVPWRIRGIASAWYRCRRPTYEIALLNRCKKKEKRFERERKRFTYLQAQEHYVGRVTKRTGLFDVQQPFGRFLLTVQIVVAKVLYRLGVFGLVGEFGQKRLKYDDARDNNGDP